MKKLDATEGVSIIFLFCFVSFLFLTICSQNSVPYKGGWPARFLQARELLLSLSQVYQYWGVLVPPSAVGFPFYSPDSRRSPLVLVAYSLFFSMALEGQRTLPIFHPTPRSYWQASLKASWFVVRRETEMDKGSSVANCYYFVLVHFYSAFRQGTLYGIHGLTPLLYPHNNPVK